MISLPQDTVLFAVVMGLLAGCGGSGEEAKTSVGPASISAQAPPATGPSAAAGRPLQPTAVVKASEAEDLLLKQQVAALQRDVAAIRAQLARLTKTAPPSDTGVPNNRPSEAAQMEFERAQAARTAAFEAAFRAEQVDAAWSRSTADSVRAALLQGKQGAADHIRGVECRSHTCRVMVDSDAMQPGGAVDLPIIVGRLAQTLPKVSVGQIDQGGDRQVSVLYLSK